MPRSLFSEELDLARSKILGNPDSILLVPFPIPFHPKSLRPVLCLKFNFVDWFFLVIIYRSSTHDALSSSQNTTP